MPSYRSYNSACCAGIGDDKRARGTENMAGDIMMSTAFYFLVVALDHGKISALAP